MFKIGKKMFINIKEVQTREPFCSFFYAKPTGLECFVNFIAKIFKRTAFDSVAESMRKYGYDKKYPITVIEENNKYTVIDGHRRLRGAKKARLKEVYIEIVNVSPDNFSGNKTKMDEALIKCFIYDTEFRRKPFSD